MFGKSDTPLIKYTVSRSLANIKWTGFLMPGERNPPQRSFLGKVISPPLGQHYSLVQAKVDKLLSEFFLRLRCRECGCLFFEASGDNALEKAMKLKENKFKFYDITCRKRKDTNPTLPTRNSYAILLIINLLNLPGFAIRTRRRHFLPL